LLSLPTGDLHIVKRGTRRVVPTFIGVQKIVVLQQFLHSSLKKISSLSFSHTAFTLLSAPPSSAPHQEPARFPWQDRRRSIRRTTMWPRALALPPQPWTHALWPCSSSSSRWMAWRPRCSSSTAHAPPPSPCRLCSCPPSPWPRSCHSPTFSLNHAACHGRHRARDHA
jgi:hypothetical protein